MAPSAPMDTLELSKDAAFTWARAEADARAAAEAAADAAPQAPEPHARGGEGDVSPEDVTQADKCPLSCVHFECMDRAYASTVMQRRDPEIDLRFEFVVFPQKKGLLGLAYAEHKEYLKLLEDRGWEEYPYWDNTDEPEGIPIKEWKARGLEWAKATGFGDPNAWLAPCEVGLTISLVRGGERRSGHSGQGEAGQGHRPRRSARKSPQKPRYPARPA